MDREQEEELQPCSRQGREGADMLARIRVCPHRPRKHWFESRCEGAARLAASHLRSRVTLPPELEDVADLQAVLDAADRLPLESCAFRGCAWTTPAEAEAPQGEGLGLREHVLEAHGPLVSNVAGVEDCYIWDVYAEALAVQERQRVPAVGAAIDRRAFEATLEQYHDDRIQASICLCCARVCFNSGQRRSRI